ncbi:MAG: NUDIX hydrolase [Candidatus Aminicenantes bacterium]|nr:NUDIX hydrolase [Candidatus Aminicenantes bacterium]
MKKFKNPVPTVDIIIEMDKSGGQPGIVLIKRKNPPHGWALPGGFVDYGESLEHAAKREAKEETSLDIQIISQMFTYSNPKRDPRFHTITTVYIAKAKGIPEAKDDAAEVRVFTREELDFPLAFDHAKILEDYFHSRKSQDRKDDRQKR